MPFNVGTSKFQNYSWTTIYEAADIIGIGPPRRPTFDFGIPCGLPNRLERTCSDEWVCEDQSPETLMRPVKKTSVYQTITHDATASAKSIGTVQNIVWIKGK